MFSRTSNLDSSNKTSNQNLKSEEFFDYIQKRNTDKIREYFSNPEYKVWQLKDENGYTILHKSVFNGDIEITSLIIEEVKKRLGMNSKESLPKFIDEKTNDGITALHYAAYRGNIPLFKLLKTNGASVDSLTGLGKNVIHMAAEGNQPSMIIYLISEEHQSSGSVDENGSTPLHWACYSGAEESVNFLLNLNADINAQDKEKLTPLHLAVSEKKENIVLKLLQKNANKNFTSSRGELPIDIARRKKYNRIVMILEDDDDYNPLCSLQTPKNYIQPNDIYKKFIFFMIIIPEIIIYLLILPYLFGYIESFINLPSFILCLLSYFLFIGKDPGYRKNNELEKESKGKYPLYLKVNEGVDVRNYCPKCYIQKSSNIKHCFICDHCVEDFNHHCFWINKCIGKNNKFLYLLFILFSLFYSNHSLYICFELLWDNVNLPYDRKYLHLNLFKDRSIRVLGASVIGIFCIIVGMPLWFLFLIEIFKFLGIYGRKKYDDNSLENVVKKATKKDAMPELELQGKEDALLPEDEKEHLINKNDRDSNNIINNVDDGENNTDNNNLLINVTGDEHNIFPDGEIKPSIIPKDNDNEDDN